MQPEMTAAGVHAMFDAQDRIRAERSVAKPAGWVALGDLADGAWEVCPNGCAAEFVTPCAGCLHAAAAARIALRNEL